MARISLRQAVIEFPIVNASSRSLQLRLYQALGGKLTAHHRTIVVRALDGIDLELDDGDRLGLIGPNGSGKTTLLRVLAGVYPPRPGAATIEGLSVRSAHCPPAPARAARDRQKRCRNGHYRRASRPA